MADVFDEVERELRDDRYRTIARRYAPYVGAVLLGVVAIVAGREYVQSRDMSRAGASAEAFSEAIAALSEDRLTDAREPLETLAATGHAGYAGLARLQLAAVIQAEGDRPRAREAYLAAAAALEDPALVDLATVKAAYAGAGDIDPNVLIAELEPLTGGDRPFAPLARELVGALAFQAGDYARSREEYAFLQLSPTTPDGVRQRAREAIAVLDMLAPRPAADIAPPTAPPLGGSL